MTAIVVPAAARLERNADKRLGYHHPRRGVDFKPIHTVELTMFDCARTRRLLRAEPILNSVVHKLNFEFNAGVLVERKRKRAAGLTLQFSS